ncbi:MAG TPA: zinc ribbon domain-containing protein [Dehalococcoidia bacterium]|nr:zinc ribbon domain-containing protein [Dehalococcoidia bacterium]
MPIYEYQATGEGCEYCQNGFEIIQNMSDKPLTECPKCQAPVKKLLSSFHACVIETPDEVIETERKISDHEKDGSWGHAAELADKAGLEDRARENYKKSGYNM